jgi:hypothetical protein
MSFGCVCRRKNPRAFGPGIPFLLFQGDVVKRELQADVVAQWRDRLCHPGFDPASKVGKAEPYQLKNRLGSQYRWPSNGVANVPP